MTAPFDVPNLDDMTTDPGELLELAGTLRLLSAYANYKARAMAYRLEGRIEEALTWERECDSLYKQLPEWARW